MKVYVDLVVNVDSNETDNELREENNKTLNIIRQVFFNYSGCNIQASSMRCFCYSIIFHRLKWPITFKACAIIADELPKKRKGRTSNDAIVASLPILR